MSPRQFHYIVVEDANDQWHEIVLLAETQERAEKTAEILFAAIGPSAFEPGTLDPAIAPLPQVYNRNAAKLLEHLFSAYANVYDVGPDRAAMSEYYDLLEAQIDAAQDYAPRPAASKTLAYRRQRAMRSLPNPITEARQVARTAANPFQPRSSIAQRQALAAKLLSRSIERDIRESADLDARVKAEHIQRRQTISRTARTMAAEMRANITAEFAPHFKNLRTQRITKDNTLQPRLEPLTDSSYPAAQKALDLARQKAHKLAIRPILAAKRDALKAQDELYQSYMRHSRINEVWGVPMLQAEWNTIAKSHARARRGPASQPTAPSKAAPSFVDRLAERARARRAQAPAREQNNTPDNEPSP